MPIGPVEALVFSMIGLALWEPRLLSLFPKDVKTNPNFLNIWAPFGAQVSDRAYAYLIVTEGENFTRFHSDFDETIDNLITLYGCGIKTWFFVKPGKLAKKLELDFRTPELFLECLMQHGTNVPGRRSLALCLYRNGGGRKMKMVRFIET